MANARDVSCIHIIPVTSFAKVNAKSLLQSADLAARMYSTIGVTNSKKYTPMTAGTAKNMIPVKRSIPFWKHQPDSGSGSKREINLLHCSGTAASNNNSSKVSTASSARAFNNNSSSSEVCESQTPPQYNKARQTIIRTKVIVEAKIKRPWLIASRMTLLPRGPGSPETDAPQLPDHATSIHEQCQYAQTLATEKCAKRRIVRVRQILIDQLHCL